MKEIKTNPLSSNFRVISEDKLTVKNQYQLMNFSIYHHEFEVAKVSLSKKSLVSDLMQAVRHKLASNKKFPLDRLLYLETLDGREVFDYSLQIDKYEIKNYTDNEKFRMVMREDL